MIKMRAFKKGMSTESSSVRIHRKSDLADLLTAGGAERRIGGDRRAAIAAES